jgi:hypothetical protein
VAKLISTPTSSEVVVFSAVYIRGSVKDYLKASPNFQQPYSLSDGCIRKEYDSNNGCSSERRRRRNRYETC